MNDVPIEVSELSQALREQQKEIAELKDAVGFLLDEHKIILKAFIEAAGQSREEEGNLSREIAR